MTPCMQVSKDLARVRISLSLEAVTRHGPGRAKVGRKEEDKKGKNKKKNGGSVWCVCCLRSSSKSRVGGGVVGFVGGYFGESWHPEFGAGMLYGVFIPLVHSSSEVALGILGHHTLEKLRPPCLVLSIREVPTYRQTLPS